MSVLIKGMEMPTSCRACHLKMNCDDCEGWECVCVPLHQQIGYLGDLLTDKRRDDCPLVPVPPHGRLIDADKLGIRDAEKQAYEAYLREKGEDFIEEPVIEYHRGYLEGLTHASGLVRFDPTIIPAEEGE